MLWPAAVTLPGKAAFATGRERFTFSGWAARGHRCRSTYRASPKRLGTHERRVGCCRCAFPRSRDEFFLLGEAPEQLNGYPFTGRIAAKQSRSIELRDEDSPVADVEKCTQGRMKMNHPGDRDEDIGRGVHSLITPARSKLCKKFLQI